MRNAILVAILSLPVAASAQDFPQVVYRPVQTWQPMYLQSVQQVPPRPPRWVLGQRFAGWLNYSTQQRRQMFTIPAYQQPIYGPQQPQQSGQ